MVIAGSGPSGSCGSAAGCRPGRGPAVLPPSHRATRERRAGPSAAATPPAPRAGRALRGVRGTARGEGLRGPGPPRVQARRGRPAGPGGTSVLGRERTMAAGRRRSEPRLRGKRVAVVFTRRDPYGQPERSQEREKLRGFGNDQPGRRRRRGAYPALCWGRLFLCLCRAFRGRRPSPSPGKKASAARLPCCFCPFSPPPPPHVSHRVQVERGPVACALGCPSRSLVSRHFWCGGT